MTNPYTVNLHPEQGDALLQLTKTSVSDLETIFNKEAKQPTLELLDDYLFAGYVVHHAMSPNRTVKKVLYGFLPHKNTIARTEMMPQQDSHFYQWNPLLVGNGIPVINPEMDLGSLTHFGLNFVELNEGLSLEKLGTYKQYTNPRQQHFLIGKYSANTAGDSYVMLAQGRKILPVVAERVRKLLDKK